MEKIRSFLALDVPSTARVVIAEIQDRLKPVGLHASWVRPDNVHLTFKFLGDIEPGQVTVIRNALGPPLSALPKFKLSLDGVGVFPNMNRPRVLWIGLEDVQGVLTTAWEVIETTLSEIGFPREARKFSPHLTLARIKSPKHIARLKQELQAIKEVPPQPFEVAAIKLYKSQLTPRGSIYTVLEEFALGGGS